ncbi:hypothetical protein FKM82_001196 [Ascaphus truei]
MSPITKPEKKREALPSSFSFATLSTRFVTNPNSRRCGGNHSSAEDEAITILRKPSSEDLLSRRETYSEYMCSAFSPSRRWLCEGPAPSIWMAAFG